MVGTITSNADARSISGTLKLEFSGTTANCSFRVINAGSDIKVTMTLWEGSKQVESWTQEGSGLVVMNEQATVSKGLTYTLEVNFTIDGTPQTSQSTTKPNS